MFCQILEVASPSGGKRINREGNSSRPVLQSSPHVLTKLLFDDKSLDEDVKFRFKQIFDRYQKLVESTTIRSPTGRLGFKIVPNSAFDPAPEYLREHGVGHVKTFSPIEQLATAVLLSVHMEERTDDELLGDIMEMRRYLREKHTDLRINQMCWSSAWDFIDSVMTHRRSEGTAHKGSQDTDSRIWIQDDESRFAQISKKLPGRNNSDGPNGDSTTLQDTHSGRTGLSRASHLRFHKSGTPASSSSSSTSPIFISDDAYMHRAHNREKVTRDQSFSLSSPSRKRTRSDMQS